MLLGSLDVHLTRGAGGAAVLACGNSRDAPREAASKWLLEHGDDAAEAHPVVFRLRQDRRGNAVHRENRVEIVRGDHQRALGMLQRRGEAAADDVTEDLATLYTLTNDPAYAHKAGVLLDRIGDLYPEGATLSVKTGRKKTHKFDFGEALVKNAVKSDDGKAQIEVLNPRSTWVHVTVRDGADPAGVAPMDGQRLAAPARAVQQEAAATWNDPGGNPYLRQVFLPRGEMTLEPMVVQSAFGPIGLRVHFPVPPKTKLLKKMPMP